MGALKDLYSPAFYRQLSSILGEVIPGFDKKKFLAAIFNAGFEEKELKQRMRHTTMVLHQFLPADFGKAIKLIRKLIIALRKKQWGEDTLAMIFLPDYIEVYGLDHFEESVEAMEFVTQFISCEFAVRPFLLKYGNKMLTEMRTWSKHPNEKVRRLASEGSRPRLPWGLAVPALKKDPAPILPILENLKNDPSDSVRRSVANSLNDIARDHPAIVLAIAAKWTGHSKETDAMVRHGSRTLLKQGHSEILIHFGLDSQFAELRGLKIHTPRVPVGGNLEFSFSVTNQKPDPQKIRLEYAILYPMKKGHSKKVYKISERAYAPGETALVQRRQKFRVITTRTFYPGIHELSVIVNGQEKASKKFDLLP